MSALLLILFFSGRWIGRISLEKKKKTPWGRHSTRRLVHEHTVSENQVQLSKIDGGMANPTFKHLHVWPSS